MPGLETWEMLSYVVTVIGLPFAIGIFFYEQRKERENEEEAVYQLLSDNYQDFLKVALDNPDLGLFSPSGAASLTPEQQERRFIIFGMLISLFERAYLLLHEESMSPKQARRRSPRETNASDGGRMNPTAAALWPVLARCDHRDDDCDKHCDCSH